MWKWIHMLQNYIVKRSCAPTGFYASHLWETVLGKNVEQSCFPTLTVPHDHDLTFEALTRIHSGLKGQFLYRSSLLHWLSLRASPRRRTTEKTHINAQLSIMTLERVRIPSARVLISLSLPLLQIYTSTAWIPAFSLLGYVLCFIWAR